jgi:hypothetical protein
LSILTLRNVYRGFVLGVQPRYDGKIYYPFEWRGSPSEGPGIRRVGPWDCQGLTEVQCCDLIQADVPDQDVNGKYIDCWFSESFYKDPFTKKMAKIFFNKASGKIDYAKPQDLANYRIQEEKVYGQVLNQIDHVLPVSDCPKDVLWEIYRGIRHALRGHPGVQSEPQIIRETILSQPGNVVNVAENAKLQTALQTVKSVFQSTSTLPSVGTEEENKVVVVVDEYDAVVDVSRLIGNT